MRFFVFLRAINVGGRVVKMERLRAELRALGLATVETFIASGNIIFESRATNEKLLRVKIERQLAQALGYEVAAFIRSSPELIEVANNCPFPPAAGPTILVAFLGAPPTSEAAKNLIACRSETDEFHVHHQEIYWLCRTRLSDSKFSGARLEKIVGMRATTRNLTTVKRLLAKYPPGVRR